MNYIKLLLPIGVALLVAILASFFEGQNSIIPLVLTVIEKGGVVIYYLRLDNSKTPFINSLTGLVIIMMIGEYLLNTEIAAVGVVIYIAANIVFLIVYFLRQIMKPKRDKLMAIKNLAVTIFCVGNVFTIIDVMGIAPAIIGTCFVGGVYFYDRLMNASKAVNYRQQSV